MNKRLIAALALMVVVAVAISALMPEAVKPVRAGDLAKPISLPDLQDKLQGLPKGKVVLLNFWATWCPPCRKEVPSMVKLYNQLKDKGFEIVAVSVDRNRDDVVRFVKEQHMNFTVLHDVNSSTAQGYGVFRYPETFIIDRNGKVRQHLNGAVEWMEPEFMDYIEKLLAEPIAK
ncbi:peroxiredoxin family protein [Ghiorsea bivora]|uniref:peroxiredoxin family protein n=1 Tax=Ghiorsea bivora TaxID=1485545 RepID=UPI00057010FC|nr:TlpA disulfide reductase family protein [Ghiorsea bivora]